MSLVALSNRILAGEVSIDEHHPFASTNELEEVADGVAFVHSFANVAAVGTDDGLALVDTGSILAADAVHRAVRGWRADRARVAVYTHGHIDHVFGTAPFEAEAPIEVIGHAALPDRFDRYLKTAGYNGVINQRQFQAPNLRWPTEYRRPDRTYDDALTVAVGSTELHLHHGRGETDDHTWVWVPDRKVLCAGDLVIWCCPNAGNPQKVQRYAEDWAVALRSMAQLDAEVLLPGHGLPVVGAAQVRAVLVDTAELLESLADQTLALMNEGARLDDIVHTVAVPDRLAALPYLQPIYDEPEFIVRNVWRLYGGWYDGDPSRLKPAPAAVLAGELATLAGGAGVLADRALALVEGWPARGDGSDGGDADADEGVDEAFRLAGHLAELAAQAAPHDPAIHRARADVFGRRARYERSLMARGVYRWAEAESTRQAGETRQAGDTRQADEG